jgi:rhomboid protease GluP
VHDPYQIDPVKELEPPIPLGRIQPYVTWILLVANVLVWLAAKGAGGTEDPQVLLDFGAMFSPLIAEGQYWRLFTGMFLHANLAHLAMNGFGLFIFGQLVERAFGHLRFLIVYILAGLFGSVASYSINTIAIAAGASGAIFGILGALAAFFVLQRQTHGKAARQNVTGVLVLSAISLGYGLITPQIDNWAHFGGFAAGFVLGLALSPRYRFATSPYGLSARPIDTTSIAGRLWVLPAAAVLLVIGAWLGGARLPDSGYVHVLRAESYFEEGDLAGSLFEVDKAIELERFSARAFYLRGLIYLEQGDPEGAVAELSTAIRFGLADPERKAKAIQLLVSIRSRRQ